MSIPFKSAIRLILLVTITQFLLQSCGTTENTADSEYSDLCPRNINDTVRVERNGIEEINIFLETSGSMTILMPQKTKTTSFQTVIPNVISRLNKGYESHFYSITDSSKPLHKIKNSDAISFINQGTFQWGLSTSIPEMIDSIQNYQKEQSVSIFITDGIFSPSKKRSTSLLLTLIGEPFSKLNSKGMSTDILCVKSDAGTIQTPYYIYILGKPEHIQTVKSEVIESLTLNNTPFEEIAIGFDSIEPYYSVLPVFEIPGNGIALACSSDKYLVVDEIVLETPLEFWVALDLSGLPVYTQSLKYLKENLVLEFKGCEGSLIEIKEVLTATDPTDKRIIDKSTHFINLSVKQIDDEQGDVSISLAYSTPYWVDEIDGNDPLQRTKTAGLKNLISGIEDSYHYRNQKHYFLKDLSVVLSKE